MSEDSLHREISELIIESSDPKEKAMLMVLVRISSNIDANTQLTKTLSDSLDEHVKAFTEHRTQFTEHEKMEMALINQGRGMWKILAWILGIAQTLLAAGFLAHVQTNTKQDERLVQVEQFVEIHKTHHAMEEKAKK